MVTRLQDAKPLYFEAHVTIEPVFEERLDKFNKICSCYSFRIATLLMKKRAEDTPVRSSYDSFCTGRSMSCTDLETRTLALCQKLSEEGFLVWRYKIESTLLDSRYDDAKLPLDKEKLPEKEKHPRPPTGE